MLLKGFLWSMGRCATKAVVDSLTDATDAEATCWVDSAKIIEAPNFYLQLLDRPTVMTLHHPQHLEAFSRLLSQLRDRPVVFTVRDPIANLASFAQTFLTSFVARRVDDVGRHVAGGKSVISAINASALDAWLMPTSNLWRQYQALKDSPHMVVDFTELGAERFATTMARISDFLGLSQRAPFAGAGEANGDADRFLVGYVRAFDILDRKIELRFTRWSNFWGEPGLVTLGTLKSQVLDAIVGPDGHLIIQAKADHVLTQGRIEREIGAFERLLAAPGVADALAAQIVVDYARTCEIVARELANLQADLIARFERTQRDGVRRFLKEHPHLAENWPRWRTSQTQRAA